MRKLSFSFTVSVRSKHRPGMFGLALTIHQIIPFITKDYCVVPLYADIFTKLKNLINIVIPGVSKWSRLNLPL